MFENPAESPHPDRPAEGGRRAGAAEREDVADRERLGPLSIARHSKDDGRALTLYSRRTDGRP